MELSETELEQIPGEGPYVKKCQGCGRPFRSLGRNARFGPPTVCRCLAKRETARKRRALARRKYRANPEPQRIATQRRAEARGLMEDYLRRHFMEPSCSYPGCDKIGWSNWRHVLQVHHCSHDVFDNPDYTRGEPLGDFQLRYKLLVVCRAHHDKYDHPGELALYRPSPKLGWYEFQLEVKMENPRKYYLTPRADLFKEWASGR